jgi:bile acid-coenzyme A ligase
VPTPLGQLLTERAAADPDFPAVTCGDDSLTRRELEARANRLARAYAQMGVGHNDFVTVALPNGVEFVTVCFAIWKLGATPSPVSAKLPPRELAAIIELANPALIVGVEPGLYPQPSLPAGYEPDAALSDDPITPVRVATSWKAATSGGSTGRPKLILSGDSSEMDPLAGAVWGMRENGVVLVPGPLYHNAPFSFAAIAQAMGNHVVLLPKFDAEAALDAIARHRVDQVNFVPTMMLRMLRVIQEHPERFDLSSLQAVWHMAAPCPEWLKEAWINLIGGDKLFELYGGTEAQAYAIINGTEWLAHRGSVGRPDPGTMCILDADGVALSPGEVGEIFMRRPEGAPPSYRYIGAEARVRDGWESLGDMGSMDADGYLYLSDRRTDMILAGGANIYPAEVEAALLEHPLIETCVVVGLPDDDLGQRVHAVVQAKEPLAHDELVSFLSDRLVRYKIPRSFRFVDEAVRDDAGKARRTAIRDEEARLAQ